MTTHAYIRPPVRAADGDAVDDLAAETDASEERGRVFPQSVASGGPTETGAILWTRIDPAVHRPDRPLGVEVAADGTFESVVLRREVPGEAVDPDADYTVRVDLDGELEPGREYAYRFVYDGVESRPGRLRTLPAADASPDSVSFAMLSCQDYGNGYFGAYGHVAESDVDYMLHLGDYIYEAVDDRYRGLGSDAYPDRRIELPGGRPVVCGLEDFRELYRTYRSDRHLQAAHEAHTMIRGWDDHAVADNRYWDYEADAPRAPNHPRGDDPAFVRRLTEEGIQAWWEYTPARIRYDPDADHLHRSFRLWRRLRFGDLLTLLMTDERLFRSPPPCNDGPRASWSPFCPAFDDPDRTMLGADQRDWFESELRSAETRWTAWANEVLTMPFRVGVGPLSARPAFDSWDGYHHERRELMRAVDRADVRNFVTLTGDLHTALAGYQRAPDGLLGTTRVGVELMTPAVTSVNIAEAVGADEGLLGRVTAPVLSTVIRAMNPHVRRFDSHHWGYSVVEFSRERCTYTVHGVDKSVDSGDADRRVLERLSIPDGRVEIRDRSRRR